MRKVLILLALCSVLCGCGEEDKSQRHPAEAYLEERFPEREVIWEESWDGLWLCTVTLEGETVDFQIAQGPDGSLTDTYDISLARWLLTRLDTLWELTEESETLRLTAQYSSRGDLVLAYGEMLDYFTLLDEHDLSLPLELWYILREDLTEWGGYRRCDAYTRATVPELEALERRYAEFLLSHQAGQKEFASLELGVYRRGMPRLELEDMDGKVHTWEEIVLWEEGRLTLAGTYALLEALELDVEGDARSFQVTGADGRAYAFSYSYRDEEGLFHYYTDGRQRPLHSLSATIDLDLLCRITGYLSSEASVENNQLWNRE